MKWMKVFIVCGLAMAAFSSAASATTVTPANTNTTLTSTNSALSLAGGTIGCTHSTITGNRGSGTATIRQIPGSLSYSGCVVFGFPMTVTNAATGGSAIPVDLTLHFQGDSTQVPVAVNITSPITMTYNVFGATCVLKVDPQELNSSLMTGAGGIVYNSSSGVAEFTNTGRSQTNLSGESLSCPASGSGSLTGTYTATPKITVEA